MKKVLLNVLFMGLAALLAACTQVPTAPPQPSVPPAAAKPAASSEVIAPNANLRVEGIPAIPKAVADRVAAYTDFRGYGLVGWHPKDRSMLVRHRAAGANIAQIHLLREPGGKPEQITDFPEPVGFASFEPKEGKYIVYSKDTGGNEASAIYRLDLDTRKSTLLSDPDQRSGATWNQAGDKLLIISVPLDRTAAGGTRDKVTTTLTLVDPLKPESKIKLAELPGTGWFGFKFSPNDSKIAATQYRTSTDTTVYLIDAKTGKQEQVLPLASQPTAGFFGFDWSKDSTRMYLTSNAGGEFSELGYLDLPKKELKIISRHIPWDIENFSLSADAKRLVGVVNNNGVDEVRMFDAVTGAELPKPNVPLGSVSGGDWHDSRLDELAFSLNSPQSPGDVYSLNAASGALTRWTTAYAPAGVQPSQFISPELVKWKSFDGREISGWLFLPDAKKFPGKRPVKVDFHGGPEAQATVRFMGRWNYFMNEMGVAILLPNVRGSTGYGKSFTKLDDGFKREDSVKDAGALLDWIGTHPRLDGTRIVISGGSYGGYMSLATAFQYSGKIRAAINIVGISNFVSFLNNTESYRRDLRRVEYGDERDPKMREFQEKIAPLNNADKIRKPLFVIHGKNDPRVPVGEAEQIATKVRGSGTPVWLLIADNEGHGFARRANADFQFFATVKFIENFVLN
jgi:dipeptidyl aminopeptidase/acylaminoacyl peptidase